MKRTAIVRSFFVTGYPVSSPNFLGNRKMNRFFGNMIVLAGATVLLGVATLAVIGLGMLIPLLSE
jgi:hypothetical protein